MNTRKILCMTYAQHTAAPVINAEECQGDCYAYDDVLKIKGEGWTVDLLRNHPLMPADVTIRGYVINTETGATDIAYRLNFSELTFS